MRWRLCRARATECVCVRASECATWDERTNECIMVNGQYYCLAVGTVRRCFFCHFRSSSFFPLCATYVANVSPSVVYVSRRFHRVRCLGTSNCDAHFSPLSLSLHALVNSDFCWKSKLTHIALHFAPETKKTQMELHWRWRRFTERFKQCLAQLNFAHLHRESKPFQIYMIFQPLVCAEWQCITALQNDAGIRIRHRHTGPDK